MKTKEDIEEADFKSLDLINAYWAKRRKEVYKEVEEEIKKELEKND